ncbi:unnamed protein product [Rangifer tarandus platyrhynchus]|uniref:Uncharacterized protein n=2 Tax=Rangifer tarandus platyrhynchus TaxID=3082113 RepID=A0ABN8Z7U0_RANTA|nr:unnamed protein product [Rangifer tarandus platyrhynchus]
MPHSVSRPPPAFRSCQPTSSTTFSEMLFLTTPLPPPASLSDSHSHLLPHITSNFTFISFIVLISIYVLLYLFITYLSSAFQYKFLKKRALSFVSIVSSPYLKAHILGAQ